MNVRNPERILAVSLFLCLVSAVFTERKGGHGIPRPRAVAAYVVMFGALALVAGLGGQAGRIAGAIGGLVAFAAVLGGTVGKSVVDLLNASSGWLAGTGQSSPPGGGVGAAVSAGVGAIGGFAGGASEFAVATRPATGQVLSQSRARP